MSNQFVKVPKINLQEEGVEMRDLVTYAYLKRHYSPRTNVAFPSYDTLAKESGMSKPTVIKCIKNLERTGYIKINKVGKTNHYTFSDIHKFEIYSFEFLDNPKYTLQDKAYIITLQPEMFKDAYLGIGKITYTDVEIAQKLNIDLRTLRKYENHLQQGDKPILTMVPTKKKDPDTGLLVQERIFDFEAYNNLIALKFQQVDAALEDKVSKTEYYKLLKEITELKKLLTTKEIEPIIL